MSTDPSTEVDTAIEQSPLVDHHVHGALLWRRGMRRAPTDRVDDGDWSAADAIRVARIVGADNARRVHRLTNAAGAGHRQEGVARE
jgi:hypothetical protein